MSPGSLDTSICVRVQTDHPATNGNIPAANHPAFFTSRRHVYQSGIEINSATPAVLERYAHPPKIPAASAHFHPPRADTISVATNKQVNGISENNRHPNRIMYGFTASNPANSQHRFSEN